MQLLQEESNERPINAILLEDYKSDAELVEYYLKSSFPNCNVRHASNEAEFINLMETCEPDIVLSDFSLPNYTALDAYSVLQKQYSDIPFIIVSGQISEIDAVELIKKGIDDYLLKSSLTRIGIAVGQALQRRDSLSRIKNDSRTLESNLEFINSILNYSGMAICEIEIPINSNFNLRSANGKITASKLISFLQSFEVCRVNKRAVELFEARDIDHFRENFIEIFDTTNIGPIIALIKASKDSKIVKSKSVQLKSFKGYKRYISLSMISRIINGQLSVILSFTDQTAVKESEQRTEKLLLRMEQTIFEKTKQLRTVNERLNEQAKQTEKTNKILEYNFNQTTSSIQMAKKIQALMLPKIETIKNSYSDAFVFYKAKDIVSGDFYWHHESEKYAWTAVADCTGHGVPGSLLAMTGSHLLSQIVKSNDSKSPHEILHLIDKHIVDRLKQRDSGNNVSTGMDMTVCRYEKSTGIIEFSGALQDLYLNRKGSIEVIKGNRRGIGGTHEYGSKQFITHSISVSKGDKLYFSSDGFPDQFGGPNGKKMMRKRFKSLLENFSGKEMKEEQMELGAAFYNWKQTCDQVDDIVVMGLKI